MAGELSSVLGDGVVSELRYISGPPREAGTKRTTSILLASEARSSRSMRCRHTARSGFTRSPSPAATTKALYGANYPDYQQVTFWSALNDVGLDTHLPLATTSNLTLGELHTAWDREVLTRFRRGASAAV